MSTSTVLPKAFEQDIHRAVKILQAGGCSEIFLFGSGSTGHIQPDSDLDLAVRGCPSGSFFSLVGHLLVELDHPVDLIDLDRQHAFAQYLEREDMLVKIA